jgi:thymidylate kinase
VGTLLARVRQGHPEKSILLTGLRGVGKTVILNRARQKAEDEGFRTVYVESPEDSTLVRILAPQLRTLLFELDRSAGIGAMARRALAVLKAFASAFRVRYGGVELALDFEPETGVADSGDLESDLPQLFTVVAEAAEERDRGVALLIDEMQYLSEPELRAVIMAMHRLQQAQKRFVLVGAGLPSLTGLSGRARSYAERLFSFPVIGALPRHESDQAIGEPVRSAGAEVEDDALTEIFRLTHGYPYFLQEWGYHSWNRASHPSITVGDVSGATEVVVRRLDEGFFRVRYDRLTPSERRYLRAMADLGPGPHRTGDVANRLHIRVTSLGPTRATLINKGMIYSPEHGKLAFTVPLFDEFMKRVIPEFPS